MNPNASLTAAKRASRRQFLRSAIAASTLVGVAPRILWPASPSSPTHASQLWGQNGELWRPTGRLPDFSFAGYHQGGQSIPDVPAGANVRDFGAAGDGRQDDTAAFHKAIAEAPQGAIIVPAGRYRITGVLDIRRSGMVLRGEGPEQTTLYCPTPLNAIRPNWGATTAGRKTSNYSWSGGMVSVRGHFQSVPLTKVASTADRGNRTIDVADGSQLSEGQWIELQQRDDDHETLAIYLYAHQPGSIREIRRRTQVSLTARVVGVHGNRVTLDRYLPFEVRLEWQPRLLKFDPSVTEVGIENLAFEFPQQPYEGHFTELGHNALALTNVANCWVRNLRILHSDSGIFARSRFCSFENVVYLSDRQPERSRQATGHHGASFSGHDNVFTQFDFRTRFMHDITVTSQASGNVFSAGRGLDICFDHHKRAPFANLFTDIDLGAGTRMYQSGGGADLGLHSAAWTTFWNLRAVRPQRWPPRAFGPDLMNLVAVASREPQVIEPEGKWLEVIEPQAIQPQNLHQAQLERRLKHTKSS